MRSKKCDDWELPEVEDWDDDYTRTSEDRQFIVIGGGFGDFDCRPRFFGCRPRFFGCRPRFFGCRPRFFFGCRPRFFTCLPRPCYPI